MGPNRRPHATPSARRTTERSIRTLGRVVFRYRAHVLVDLAVAALVLSLPMSLQSGPAAAIATTMTTETGVVAMGDVEAGTPRARTVSRSATITAASAPRTAIAEDVRPIVHYTIGPSDSLQSLGNFYKVSAEAIAFSNGITDPNIGKQAGRTIMIPPGEGALYTVKEEDTVEAVATRFKVDPRAIMEYNRLYFEPEHFGPGQLIFVPGAIVPGLKYIAADPSEVVPVPLVPARPAPVAATRTGTLAWPVGGRITQYFWGFHTGVDIAAPYGTGVGASEAGTVVAAGWVPVGGIGIRVQHANGLETGYYHLGAVFVAPGQRVTRGQIIGTIGVTGVTTGAHVHWEAKLNGAFVNPLTN